MPAIDLLYRQALRPLLFRLDAEQAHHLTLRALGVAARLPLPAASHHPALRQGLWGLQFGSPLGLAAGLDKNGEALRAFAALGFGFLEVGTVTPRLQAGNPAPRLFRLPEDQALINRMGFNNLGAEHLAAALRRQPLNVPVWVNIGKNKDTPNGEAAGDYRALIRGLYEQAQGFVVNVSSPNTPNLRALQQADELHDLLQGILREAERQRVRSLCAPRPVLVKLAPDLSEAEFLSSLNAAQEAGVSGVILSNTTLARANLRHPARVQAGGLSGRPLQRRSTELVARAYQLTRGQLPIVGVGGIFSAQDAYDKIRAGASLVEVYSGLIYEGPGLPRRVSAGLLKRMRADGFSHISEAVGADHR